MKKDTFYFTHDATAKDDPKCMLLIDQLGLEGYGIFWVLVETLRTQPDYKCPINIIPSLARRYNTTQEKMKAVLMGYELFTIQEDTIFFSDSLMRRMQMADAKRQHLSELGKRGAEARYGKLEENKPNMATLSPPYSHPIASKGKESKVKESKVKEKKINTETELLNSEIWHESVSMALNLTPDEVKTWISKFIAEVKAKEQFIGRPLRELKGHAVSWIKIELSKKKKSAQYDDDWRNELSRTPPPLKTQTDVPNTK